MTADVDTIARNALQWAEERLGSTDYTTRCLAFVEDAVERANEIEIFGGDYASESARLYGAAVSSDPPPLGAFVFYRSVGVIRGVRRDWGHVGLSVGDGRIIHAWDRVRIDDLSSLPALTPAAGWDPFSATGWTPLHRILEGSRSARWTTDAAAAAVEQQRRALAGDREAARSGPTEMIDP